jgi:peptide/nickel transport system substrate-binding protein
MRRALLPLAALCLLATGARRPVDCSGDYCGTLVFVAGGKPDILLPPVSVSTLARDIHDQIFLKLADLGMTLNTVGDQGFVPQLARRWTWQDSLTLVFHLDPRARWQDGPRVTAADVAFTFDAYRDPQVKAASAPVLSHIASVTARDSLTAVFRFKDRYPEMFYDAVYHMRVLPAHLLASVPRDQWLTADYGRAPVGDGPYRFVAWTPEYIELAADSTFFLGRPHVRRLLWRFATDLQVAVTQLMADQADALETLGPPTNITRVQTATQLATYRYAGTNYAYLEFNLAANGDSTQPHPLFGDRALRRALAMAVDRDRLCQSVWGVYAKVPPGPMPQQWWLWKVGSTPLPFDTVQAVRALAADGWVDSDGDGVRDKHGVKLTFHLVVPTTSGSRRQYARLLQAQFRAVGADAQIDELDPVTFNQRLQAGLFDAAIPAWNTDPTPSSSFAQSWTRAGFGGFNYGRYSNANLERALDRATLHAADPQAATRAWREVLDTLNQDAPGVWLFAPDNVAAVHNRVSDVRIRPDSWWALVWTWRILPERLIDRDRAER